LIKRSDDNESTVTNRLKTYDEQTLPILDYYREKGIVKDVDAMKAINEVTDEIKAIISNL
jgi:adenylate kinase